MLVVLYATLYSHTVRCGSSPLSLLKLLPQGCTLIYPDGTSQTGPGMYNSGSCSNLLCQANNSYCGEGERCCCQVFTTSTAIMECSDGVKTELIVTSCGCQRCSPSIMVQLTGTVQAGTSSLPIQAAAVVIDGGTSLLTDVNGMFNFSVPSTQASVSVIVTAIGYMPFNEVYDISPGENNNLVITLVKLAVSRPVTLLRQSVLVVDGEDAITSNSTSAISSNSSNEVLNAVANSGNVFVGISSDVLLDNDEDDMQVVMVQSTFINFTNPDSFDLLTTDDLSTPVMDNNTNETVLMPIEALSAGLINVQNEEGETILEESEVELNTALDNNDFNITDANAQIGVYQVNKVTGQYERLEANVTTEVAITGPSSKRRRQTSLLNLLVVFITVRLRFSVVFVIAFTPPPMLTCHAAVLVVQDNGGVDEVVNGVDVQLEQRPSRRRFLSRTESSPACVVISCTGSLVVRASRNGRSLLPDSYSVDVPKSINITVFTSLDQCQSSGLSLNNLQQASAFVFRDDPLPVATTTTPATTPPPQQVCVMRLTVTSCMHLDVEVVTTDIDDTFSLTIMRSNQSITEYQSGFTCDDMRTACIEISCSQLTTVTAVYMRGGAVGDAKGCSLTLVDVQTGSPLGGDNFTFKPSVNDKSIFEDSSLDSATQQCENSLDSSAHFECVEIL